MNKRLIAQLIGGGVALPLAALAGLKLRDVVESKSKYSYYKGLTRGFKAKRHIDEMLKTQYLPEWDNDVHWGKLNDKGMTVGEDYEKAKFKDRFPTTEDLKNFCFKEAAQDRTLAGCNPNQGWCELCLRDESWDKSPN